MGHCDSSSTLATVAGVWSKPNAFLGLLFVTKTALCSRYVGICGIWNILKELQPGHMTVRRLNTSFFGDFPEA